MYFYSFELTPIERQLAATGRDPDLLRNWEAILQITAPVVSSVNINCPQARRHVNSLFNPPV
jgi:hypothetical protein